MSIQEMYRHKLIEQRQLLANVKVAEDLFWEAQRRLREHEESLNIVDTELEELREQFEAALIADAGQS